MQGFLAAIILSTLSLTAQSIESHHSLTLPSGDPDSFSVQWTQAGQSFAIDLHRFNLRTASFQVRSQEADGSYTLITAPRPRTYRGQLKGQPEVRVSAGLQNDGLRVGLFYPDGRSWFLEPDGTGKHWFHRDAGLPAHTCGTKHKSQKPNKSSAIDAPPGQLTVAEIAFDIDVEYYQYKGSSISACIAEVEQNLDATNQIYERDVQITHRISHIIIRKAEPDPYSGNDAGTILKQHRTHWNTTQQAVPRDLAHFITSRSMGNILGLAWVGVVCSQSGYGLSRWRSNFSQNVTILGHELGHNWSAPHCLDPKCVLMCGGCHQFGPLTIARIIAHRDSRSCLSRLYAELGAHYTLDEAGGFLAFDESGNGNTGVFLGGIGLGKPGAQPGTVRSASFDGLDDTVQINGQSELNRIASEFTVTAWVRPGRLSGDQRFVSHIGSWSFGMRGDRLLLTIPNVRDYLSTAQLKSGIWQHVAVTTDSNGKATFYLDGQNQGSITGSQSTKASNAYWFLASADGKSEFYRGELDDVQIYNGSLSATQLALLHAHPGRKIEAPNWSTYGQGLAGTQGIPYLSPTRLPMVGDEFRFDIDNSAGTQINSVLIFGTQKASLPLLGGTVLVAPLSGFATAITLPSTGLDYRIPIPNDPRLNGVEFFMQAIEIDPGASLGFSFTPGLQVRVGG